jgi:hypothetical protein
MVRSGIVAGDPARPLGFLSFATDLPGKPAPICGGEHLSAMVMIEHLADLRVLHHASTLRSPVT